jgi:hypothetical protein
MNPPQEETIAENQVPVKRKRGRPKKIQKEEKVERKKREKKEKKEKKIKPPKTPKKFEMKIVPFKPNKKWGNLSPPESEQDKF